MEQALQSLTADVLRGLALGDVLEIGRLFGNMSEEPVAFSVANISDKGAARAIKFSMSSFGVDLGTADCLIKAEGDVKWLMV